MHKKDMFALQKGKNINKGFVCKSVKLIAWHLHFYDKPWPSSMPLHLGPVFLYPNVVFNPAMKYA